MTSLTLNGTIEKDAFKSSGGGKEGTMYAKLEVIVEKGHPKKILAEDLNIEKLNKLSLLVLKTKDEKYDGIDIKYKVNMDSQDTEEAKLNSTKVLWLNLENKKPFSSLVDDHTTIKNIELWLDKEQPAEEAAVDIMVLRRVDIIDITTKVEEAKKEIEADTTYKPDTTYKTDKADTTDYPGGGKARSERSKKQPSEEQKPTPAQAE